MSILGCRTSDTEQAGDRVWSRLLLVEGTSGVGKSTPIDELIRRSVASQPPRKLRTLLHLTKPHTYGPLAARRGRRSVLPWRDR
jgi:hypothetical protein